MGGVNLIIVGQSIIGVPSLRHHPIYSNALLLAASPNGGFKVDLSSLELLFPNIVDDRTIKK